VESRLQLSRPRRKVKAAGAHILRGGAFKPRTSPYAFQGSRTRVEASRRGQRETGLPIVTEVMEPDKVDLVAEHADISRSCRNVQNFSLLKRVGDAGKPVLLSAQWRRRSRVVLSAEYVLARGNPTSFSASAHPDFEAPRATPST